VLDRTSIELPLKGLAGAQWHRKQRIPLCRKRFGGRKSLKIDPRESRHDRIARAAYYLSEARGFELGHDAEDWLLAQSAIDALDASISLRQ
jgi:hypothetical protein